MSDKPFDRIVFTDARVGDPAIVADSASPDTRCCVLDPAIDGLDQIADTLRAVPAGTLRHLCIIATGGPGHLVIGPAGFDVRDIEQKRGALAAIRRSLHATAEVSLIAPNAGAGRRGSSFATLLSGELGVPVLAPSGPVHASEHARPVEHRAASRVAPLATSVTLGILRVFEDLMVGAPVAFW